MYSKIPDSSSGIECRIHTPLITREIRLKVLIKKNDLKQVPHELNKLKHRKSQSSIRGLIMIYMIF